MVFIQHKCFIGYLEDLVPQKAPENGEKWDEIFTDVERVIMSGVCNYCSFVHRNLFYRSPDVTSIV